MKIEKRVLGMMSTNCYLVKNEETKEMILIDPAMCPESLIEEMRTGGYTLRAILLTHGHFDHIMGIPRLVAEYNIPVYCHEEEKEVLLNPEMNLSAVFGTSFSYTDVEGLTDGEEIEIAGNSFQVIHTPGHTKGGCCYYVKDEQVLFSGDTLFCQSVGRSDFPTGSMSTLVRSIKEKLFTLPDETVVYPGHDAMTSIGDEKKYNPFM